MAERTVYCEECVEDIPASEVYWDDGRLYCRRCGSEVEPPDRDIFEEIVDNRSGFLFRDEELHSHDAVEADEEEEEEETPAPPAGVRRGKPADDDEEIELELDDEEEPEEEEAEAD